MMQNVVHTTFSVSKQAANIQTEHKQVHHFLTSAKTRYVHENTHADRQHEIQDAVMCSKQFGEEG